MVHGMAGKKKNDGEMLGKMLSVCGREELNRFLGERAAAHPEFCGELTAWLRETLMPVNAGADVVRKRVADIFKIRSLQEIRPRGRRPYEKYTTDWQKISDALHLLFDALAEEVDQGRGSAACEAMLEFLTGFSYMMQGPGDFGEVMWAVHETRTLLPQAMRCPDVTAEARRAHRKEIKHIGKLYFFKNFDTFSVIPGLLQEVNAI